MAQGLYQCAIDQVIPVSSPKVAEMTKLLENTFRATNIALVNEITITCSGCPHSHFPEESLWHGA